MYWYLLLFDEPPINIQYNTIQYNDNNNNINNDDKTDNDNNNNN